MTGLPKRGCVVLFEKQCGVCHIGVLRVHRVTYASWSEQQLVLLPNVSIWACDVCGESAYDPEIVEWVNMLLGIDYALPVQTKHLDSANNLSLSMMFSGRRRNM